MILLGISKVIIGVLQGALCDSEAPSAPPPEHLALRGESPVLQTLENAEISEDSLRLILGDEISRENYVRLIGRLKFADRLIMNNGLE